MNIAFIGLGIMGKPMAKNLACAGHTVTGFNRSPVVSEQLLIAPSIAKAVENSRVIITMLPDSPDVEQVALAPGGIADNAQPGSLLIDMSSIAPEAAKKTGAALAKKEIRMIDAPVSGGETGAIEKTLTVMAGGSEDDFAEAYPILMDMAASATLIGPLGSGNVCKLVNQIIVASNIAALAEGLNFAVRAGADTQKVFEAVRGGLAGSRVMETKGPMMLSGDERPGFKIDLHRKDMNNVIKTAAEISAQIPIAHMVTQMFDSMQKRGKGQCDHSALYEYYKK